MSADVRITRVDASAVQPWRHRWLRPHQPIEQACFAGDAQGIHLLATRGDTVLAIGTALPNAHPDFSMPAQWRLRGMACHPEHRSQGIGGQLLRQLLSLLVAQETALAWCNARVPASRFYLRHGFDRHGEAYDIPGIGPHYLMARALSGVAPAGV